MNNEIRRRSTRDRPAKAPLSEASIVDAALKVLRADGLECVTMRRVALALDTGPASLYVYVAGREGLLEAMLDRVVATVELDPPDSARWRTQLHALLGRLRQALDAHPGIAAMTLADPPTTEAVLLFTENLLGILLAGGIDPQDAAWTCDILVLLVTGAASEQQMRRPPGHSDQDLEQQVDQIHTTFASLPSDRFPLLCTHAEAMVAGDGSERLSFALDMVIDGVVARTRPR